MSLVLKACTQPAFSCSPVLTCHLPPASIWREPLELACSNRVLDSTTQVLAFCGERDKFRFGSLCFCPLFDGITGCTRPPRFLVSLTYNQILIWIQIQFDLQKFECFFFNKENLRWCEVLPEVLRCFLLIPCW